MGITGLLPLMKGAISSVKLSNLSGTVAAIDTNGWLHRACYSCGDKVYLNEETDAYINYCISMCSLLKKHNITPILVFDGQGLPAKSETKEKRNQRKQEVRCKIEEMITAGDMRGARWLMRQCVDVTFEMCHRVIVRCREEKIDYIVAPFEADAQISYLVNHGIADYAITEDSDLLVFGCKSILYKLDRENEKGDMLSLEKLDKCFKGFSQRKFQFMCILSGCDYLANIPKVGMGRARKFFEGLSEPISLENIREILKKMPSVLHMVGKVKVTDEYIDSFIRAVHTFDYQLVFSPFSEQFTHLKNLEGGIEQHRKMCLGEYAGEFFTGQREDFNLHYALGNIHTKSLEKIDVDFSPFLNQTEDNNDELNSYFTEIVRQRIKSRRCMSKIVENRVIIPESPIKPSSNKSIDKINENKDQNDDDDSCRKSKRKLDETKKVISKRVKSLSTKKSPEKKTKEKLSKKNKTFEESNCQSRNVFRQSANRLKSSDELVKSQYFKKDKKLLENISPKKDSQENSSDFDEKDLDDFREVVKMTDISDISVSDIDEEEKSILTSLNNTQSSGYSSQASSQSSLLPDVSFDSRLMKTSSKRKSNKLSSRNSSRRSSRSSTASADIRNYFSKKI